MEHYLIIARSVTHAQRMQKVLFEAGMNCPMFRPPRELTNFGCVYALKIRPEDLKNGMMALHRENLTPIQIFLYQYNGYQEVFT